MLHPLLTLESARPSSGAGAGAPGTGRAGGLARPTLEPWKQPVFRVAVVPIEFPDTKHNPKVSLKDWEHSFLATPSASDASSNKGKGDRDPGTLNNYFREQSGGAFRLEGKVFEWIEVSKKRAEYAPGSGTTNITAVLVEALNKVAARDGKDALQRLRRFPLPLRRRARAHPIAAACMRPTPGSSAAFSRSAGPMCSQPEGGARPTALGVFVKEFCRVLGLPDLAARRENPDIEGLGVWCALSNTFTTNRPQHLSAWAKEKLGWLKPAVIDPTVVQKLVLAPIEDSPQECFKILVRSDGSEYFLLENRARKGFDQNLPAEGLLIWRVIHDRPIPGRIARCRRPDRSDGPRRRDSLSQPGQSRLHRRDHSLEPLTAGRRAARLDHRTSVVSRTAGSPSSSGKNIIDRLCPRDDGIPPSSAGENERCSVGFRESPLNGHRFPKKCMACCAGLRPLSTALTCCVSTSRNGTWNTSRRSWPCTSRTAPSRSVVRRDSHT